MLSSSADARFDGDSRYTNPASGFFPSPGKDIVEFMLTHYFDSADLRDPIISPVWSMDLLSRFPAVFISTSTRAHEFSSAVFTHSRLVKAGAKADLHVWDGLPHNFHLSAEIPESMDALGLVLKCFDSNLKAL